MRKGQVNQWVPEPLSSAVEKTIDRVSQAADFRWLAIMPDVHLAKDACVGLVLATDSLVYPQAIGGDIGCGYLVVGLDTDVSMLQDERHAARLMNGLYEEIPWNRRPGGSVVSPLPPTLTEDRLSDDRLHRATLRDGRFQMGTLGRGNHFVEFQADQDDRLWLVIHSGSRAMGQLITQHHLQQATLDKASRLSYLDTLTENGVAYLNDQEWARRYAAANRLAMLKLIEDVLSREFAIATNHKTLIHRDHNHVASERHFDRTVYVHRKGAQVASAGERSIVPGSMGTESYLVEGRGVAEAMNSFSHGAGRRMSRAAARKVVSPSSFLRQVDEVWFDTRKTDRLLDESPEAYKDIVKVMRAQRELVKIVDRHRPVLNFKAG